MNKELFLCAILNATLYTQDQVPNEKYPPSDARVRGYTNLYYTTLLGFTLEPRHKLESLRGNWFSAAGQLPSDCLQIVCVREKEKSCP